MDLKEYRNKEFKNYVILNIFIILFYSIDFCRLNIEELKVNFEVFQKFFPLILSSSAIYVYVFLIDSLLPDGCKAKFVNLWSDLPGFTVFTNIKKEVKDGRFTKEQAAEKYNDIYEKMDEISDPDKLKRFENAEWYKIYQKYKESTKILISNRDYLLCRDLCSISLLILIIYIVVTICFDIIILNWDVVGFLFTEYIITNIAARHKAKRFVMNVISEDINKKDNEF